jgi:hypothetical protein
MIPETHTESLPTHDERHGRGGGGKWISLLLLAVVPAVFFLVTTQLTRTSGPQWLGSNFENSYSYLYNALLIATGQTPHMVNHPGVTTQVFGATVLAVKGRATGDQLAEKVINRPESYLRAIHRSLLLCVALASWLAPWLVTVWFGRWWDGVLLQVPLLFFNTLLCYTIWFGSDLMLIGVSLITIVLCFVLLRQPLEQPERLWLGALTGILCGIGMITKLNFFSLVIISFFVCPSWKQRQYFLLGFFGSIVVGLVPIYPRLIWWLAWIFGLVTHTGYYGGGDTGFISPGMYLLNLRLLVDTEPLVAIIPIVTALMAFVLLSVAAREGGVDVRRLRRTILGLTVVQLISLLLVAKHAHPHYLIPIFLSTGLNLWLLAEAIRRATGSKLLRLTGVAVCGGLVVVGLQTLLSKTTLSYGGLRTIRIAQQHFYHRVLELTKNKTRIDYYRSISPQFASYWGNDWAGGAFAKQLKKRFPGALFFNIFNSKFQTFDSFIEPPEVLATHDHLYFFGNLGDNTGLPYFKSAELSLIEKGGGLTATDSDRPFYLHEWHAETPQ